MTRRSSARLTPRTSVGKCGSIRAHCSSLSQNRFLLINPSPNTNQYRIVESKGLMSSDPSMSKVAPVWRPASLLISQVLTVFCSSIDLVQQNWVRLAKVQLAIVPHLLLVIFRNALSRREAARDS